MFTLNYGYNKKKEGATKSMIEREEDKPVFIQTALDLKEYKELKVYLANEGIKSQKEWMRTLILKEVRK